MKVKKIKKDKRLDKGDLQKFCLSSYVTMVDIGEGVVVSHGPRLWRMTFDYPTAKFLNLFKKKSLSKSEVKKSKMWSSEQSDQLFEFFKDAKLIIPKDMDEPKVLKKEFNLFVNSDGEVDLSNETEYNTLVRTQISDINHKSFKPLRFLLFGGCVMDYLKDHLKKAGLRAGYDVTSFQRWDLEAENYKNYIEEIKPDILVFQPGMNSLLGPLWDHMTSISAEERRTRLDELKSRIERSVNTLSEMAKGRMVLIHNIAGLQYSPFGRGGFRVELNFREILAELNQHIEHLIKDHQNILLVDEELIGARTGLKRVFDDNYYPFSHHGGQFDIKVENSTQLPIMSEIFAAEYFECYKLWSGKSKIKCIVCDLDGTMWPGIAAENGFSWVDGDTTSRWVHVGIHESLRVLKSRGILLATSSKNSEEVTLTTWGEATKTSLGKVLLSPNDFVVHKISWNKKSIAIRDIAETIGIGLDSILFLDDNPVEREEVRQNLPGVQVYDGEMHDLREFLLSNPRLEVNSWTQESSQRTEMTKAQIKREETRKSAVSEDDFLKSLEIRMNIEKVVDQKNLPRIVELVQRTNQFNTTLKRYDAESISSMLSLPEVSMYTFSAEDKFTSYGLVGFVMLKAGSVEIFVMSCRVLGLNVAVPFLVSALNHSDQIKLNPRGEIVEGPRNEPCRDLFLKAGFKKQGEGKFALEKVTDLYKVDQSVYKVTFLSEIKKDREVA